MQVTADGLAVPWVPAVEEEEAVLGSLVVEVRALSCPEEIAAEAVLMCWAWDSPEWWGMLDASWAWHREVYLAVYRSSDVRLKAKAAGAGTEPVVREFQPEPYFAVA